MAKKKPCPKCQTPMAVICEADSDERINSSWYGCPCGYDQRKDAYAEKVRQAFREITGWKVESGTRIHEDIGDFCNERDGKRDASELAAIFAIKIGAIKI